MINNFTKNNAKLLKNIIKTRRDIRGNNFLPTNISKSKINKIIDAGLNAPSVGYSQPWKFVIIKKKNTKQKIFNNFIKEYDKSKRYFKDRPIYNTLKLEGIIETPINIAVYYKRNKTKILGQTSQKKMGEYSVVCAIQNMWLMARALNIGIGWVSILNPKKVNKILKIKSKYKLIAYLCVGYVKEFPSAPELKNIKWEKEKKKSKIILWN